MRGNTRTETTLVDAETQKELDALMARLTAAGTTNIGFPAATDFDFTPLAGFFARFLLNNLGDPAVNGDYPHHTKEQEREAVDAIADLLRAPADDRWGYVTTGSTEGTEFGLWQARIRFPDGIVYHSRAAHHTVTGVLERLSMRSIVVCADPTGEIDYEDLAGQIQRHRDRPAIVVASVGTGMSEAVDDVRRITAILDELAVDRRWIHADAALSGIPLALLEPDQRPGFDFADGATSMIVSGHKFPGSPIPYGVVVLRDSFRALPGRPTTYTGSPDTTVANSRCGLAALGLWYTLRRYGVAGLRERAEHCRELAAYTHGRLIQIGWPGYRHPHAFTVVLDSPPPVVAQKWALASSEGRSHIICMPGVTREQIDALVADLRAVTAEERAEPAATAQRNGGRFTGRRLTAALSGRGQ